MSYYGRNRNRGTKRGREKRKSDWSNTINERAGIVCPSRIGRAKIASGCFKD